MSSARVGLVLTVFLALMSSAMTEAMADDYDALLGMLLDEPAPKRLGCETGQGPAPRSTDPLEFRRDHIPYGSVCGTHPKETTTLLCDAATAACRTRNPLADSGGVCANTNPEFRNARASSGELRGKIQYKALEFFSRSLRNDQLVESCCKQAKSEAGEELPGAEAARNSCRKSLAATKLEVTTKDSDPSEYSFANNTVYISRKQLLQFLSEESVERLILHELGHACTRARHVANAAAIKAVGASGCMNEALPILEADLEALFGFRAANCVTAAVRSAGSGVCQSDWMHEAFADAVFYGARSSLTHWAWDCSGKEDRHHGAPRNFIPCFADTAPLKSLVCP